MQKKGCRNVHWINPDTWKTEREACGKLSLKNKHFSNTTDMSFYDGLIKYPRYHKQAKGICSRIDHISPDKYLQESARIHFAEKDIKIDSKEILRDMAKVEASRVDKKYVNLYYQQAKKGSKMPLPVLDYRENSQEGRHRAVVAKKLGLKKIPVLVVEGC